MDLADQFDDPAFFEVPDPNVRADPAFIAEIADRLGRPDDVKEWLRMAAEAGDIEAMCQLIEEFDHGDPQKCWMWVYLAELIGEDLTEDRHYAIHDDGSLYDDDVGGNAFILPAFAPCPVFPAIPLGSLNHLQKFLSPLPCLE